VKPWLHEEQDTPDIGINQYKFRDIGNIGSASPAPSFSRAEARTDKKFESYETLLTPLGLFSFEWWKEDAKGRIVAQGSWEEVTKAFLAHAPRLTASFDTPSTPVILQSRIGNYGYGRAGWFRHEILSDPVALQAVLGGWQVQQKNLRELFVKRHDPAWDFLTYAGYSFVLKDSGFFLMKFRDEKTGKIVEIKTRALVIKAVRAEVRRKKASSTASEGIDQAEQWIRQLERLQKSRKEGASKVQTRRQLAIERLAALRDTAVPSLVREIMKGRGGADSALSALRSMVKSHNRLREKSIARILNAYLSVKNNRRHLELRKILLSAGRNAPRPFLVRYRQLLRRHDWRNLVTARLYILRLLSDMKRGDVLEGLLKEARGEDEFLEVLSDLLGISWLRPPQGQRPDFDKAPYVWWDPVRHFVIKKVQRNPTWTRLKLIDSAMDLLTSPPARFH
jgi:hypothetical protein